MSLKSTIEVRMILPSDVDHLPAMHRALALPVASHGSGAAPAVAELLAKASDHKILTEMLYGGYDGDELVGVALAVEPPGRAALTFVAPGAASPRWIEATVGALRALKETAWRRGVLLLESLLIPGKNPTQTALLASGFDYLTCLRYLRFELPPERIRSPTSDSSEIHWVSYGVDRADLFCGVIAKTYAQSLDCPELSGLRPVEEVLAGHLATGTFVPGCWWVALQGESPVGVILLNRISAEPAFEVVYMGVAQPARRAGVAKRLLRKAMVVARENGATELALAVDERNAPARAMYRRWGFVEHARRAAYIATPAPE